jgi:hypothetical protein
MKSVRLKSVLYIVAVGLMLAIPAVARVHHGRAGKSHIAFLALYEKDPATWEIVENGAWGVMRYNIKGPVFRFVLVGHGLDPLEEYTLIYYPDPWPGFELICLGSALAGDNGNVSIVGMAETGNLPMETDENFPDGAKIWLVRSADLNCVPSEDNRTRMIAWNPTEYLFEFELITYEETERKLPPEGDDDDDDDDDNDYDD